MRKNRSVINIFLIFIFFFVGCSTSAGDDGILSPQQKRNRFSSSTEIGRMFIELLDVIEFGHTDKDEIGQKLCGRAIIGGIYPEELEGREITLVSQMGTVINPYKTDCPAMSEKWGAIAAANSIQIIYDSKNRSCGCLPLPFY